MKRTLLASLVTASMCATAPAMAEDIHSELATLKAKVKQLEKNVEQQKQHSEENDWSKKVSISGTAEFLGTFSKNDADGSESDLDMDSVELSIDAEINENIALSATLKYEDDNEEQDFYVDEAIIKISSAESPWALTLGRTGIPFSVINGKAWTDPLTDDLTDNTDDIAQLSYSNGTLNSDIYIFRAKHDNEEENSVENVGINVGMNFDNGVSIGAGYVNNIKNTEAFTADSLLNNDKVAAFRINLAYEINTLALSAEYIKTDNFDTISSQPHVSVWHTSADYGLDLLGAPGNLSLGYSETDNAELITDAGDSLFAKSRLTLGASRELNKNAEVIIELVREESYAGNDTDSVNIVLSSAF